MTTELSEQTDVKTK